MPAAAEEGPRRQPPSAPKLSPTLPQARPEDARVPEPRPQAPPRPPRADAMVATPAPPPPRRRPREALLRRAERLVFVGRDVPDAPDARAAEPTEVRAAEEDQAEMVRRGVFRDPGAGAAEAGSEAVRAPGARRGPEVVARPLQSRRR